MLDGSRAAGLTPTILLFDIDGTLLSSGGAGRRAMDAAFGHVCGRSDACAGMSMGGMTDRFIVREGLQAIGVAASEARIGTVLEAYLGFLKEEVANASDYRLHPGVPEALAASERRNGVAIGLGTGNVERGARIKLGRAGIAERFGFGGFGCDAEDRGALLAIGAARGAGRLGLPVEACRVVVIGDTPRDIAAARAIRAEVVAVATGPFELGALRACKPDWAFRDLACVGALEAILGR